MDTSNYPLLVVFICMVCTSVSVWIYNVYQVYQQAIAKKERQQKEAQLYFAQNMLPKPSFGGPGGTENSEGVVSFANKPQPGDVEVTSGEVVVEKEPVSEEPEPTKTETEEPITFEVITPASPITFEFVTPEAATGEPDSTEIAADIAEAAETSPAEEETGVTAEESEATEQVADEPASEEAAPETTEETTPETETAPEDSTAAEAEPTAEEPASTEEAPTEAATESAPAAEESKVQISFQDINVLVSERYYA